MQPLYTQPSRWECKCVGYVLGMLLAPKAIPNTAAAKRLGAQRELAHKESKHSIASLLRMSWWDERSVLEPPTQPVRHFTLWLASSVLLN